MQTYIFLHKRCVEEDCPACKYPEESDHHDHNNEEDGYEDTEANSSRKNLDSSAGTRGFSARDGIFTVITNIMTDDNQHSDNNRHVDIRGVSAGSGSFTQDHNDNDSSADMGFSGYTQDHGRRKYNLRNTKRVNYNYGTPLRRRKNNFISPAPPSPPSSSSPRSPPSHSFDEEVYCAVYISIKKRCPSCHIHCLDHNTRRLV